MQAKLIAETPERTFALILDTGDEIVSCLERFAVEAELSASRLTAIGALHDVTLGYFDWDRKSYRPHRYAEQLEVLSLVGDIAMDGESPKVHAHIVLGRGDCSTLGGHLLRGIVRPTLEILVTDAPAHLRRVHDPESGLALIRVEAVRLESASTRPAALPEVPDRPPAPPVSS